MLETNILKKKLKSNPYNLVVVLKRSFNVCLPSLHILLYFFIHCESPGSQTSLSLNDDYSKNKPARV